MALLLAVVLLVGVLASSALAAPYGSFGEFVQDQVNAVGSAITVRAAVYQYKREVSEWRPAPAAFAGGFWGGVTRFAHQHFVVGPRITETMQSWLWR